MQPDSTPAPAIRGIGTTDTNAHPLAARRVSVTGTVHELRHERSEPLPKPVREVCIFEYTAKDLAVRRDVGDKICGHLSHAENPVDSLHKSRTLVSVQEVWNGVHLGQSGT